MSDQTSARIAIVTGQDVTHLTENGQSLRTELRSRGLSAEPVVWTNPRIDWSAFDVALVRSCWKYHTQIEKFRKWLESVENAGVVLLNPAGVIRWNVHKSYLRELADDGVSILPTAWVERGGGVDLQTVLRRNDWPKAVVKPAIGTSSAGVWRTSIAEAASQQQRFETVLSEGDALVQEFAPEIVDGERSLVFFEGNYSHAWNSLPAENEFRAHPSYGGSIGPYEPSRNVVNQAANVLRTACSSLTIDMTELLYARVDGIERDGGFRLMELELVEPYLSLDTDERALATFVDGIESSLRRHWATIANQ